VRFFAAITAIGVLLASRPAMAADTYTIDVLMPLTGPAAFVGQAQQQAARVYETIVNRTGGIHGQPLHFEIHDDQGNPTTAVQLTNEIMTRHPAVILGPSISGPCGALAPLLVNGPLEFCFSPALEPANRSFVFASSATEKTLLYSGYARVRALGYKRLAAIIANDASGQFEMQYTKEALALTANQSMKLVALETFAPADISVAAQVAKIKAANPDILYVWAVGTAFGTVIRELANSGVNVPVVTPPTNTNLRLLAQYHDFLPKTLVTSGMPYQGRIKNAALEKAASEYLDGLKEADVKPDTMQAYAWDPMRIVVSALRALPAGASAAQVRDYIETMHGFSGIMGSYDFRGGDQHGLDGNDIPYLVWDPAQNAWKYFDAGPKT
jgi:branched-chain amino acid transport system substrate-binding protein